VRGTRAATVVALSSLALLAVSCAKKPASIRVTPPKQTIYGLKRTKSVAAEVLDKKGEQLPGFLVQWSSSKPAVVTVQPTGSLKSVTPGKAVITATLGPLSGTANVDVVDIQMLEVTPARVTLAGPKGATAALSAEAKDSKGKLVTGVSALWTSSDTKVALIDNKGVLTSVGEGKTTITAAIGDVGGGADVAVTFREIGAVEVSPLTLILKMGETQSVRAIVKDTRGAPVEDAAVTWTTSDPSVATCYNGMVTGKSTGTTTIRGTCGTKVAEVSVFVN